MREFKEQIVMSKFLNNIFIKNHKKKWNIMIFIILLSWSISAPLTLLFPNYFYMYSVTENLVILSFTYLIISKLLLLIKGEVKSDNCKSSLIKGITWFFLNKPWYVYLLIMFVLSFIASCLATDKYLAFIGTTYMKDGFTTYCFYAAIYIIACNIDNKKEREIILKVMVVGASFLCVVSIFQYIGAIQIYDIFHWHLFRDAYYTGTFENTNHYGYYLTIIIMCSASLFITELKQRSKIIFLLLFTLNSWVLLMNSSLGCFIAVLFGLVIMALIFKKKYKGLFIIYFIPLLVFLVLSIIVTLFMNGINILYEFMNLGGDMSSIITDMGNAGDAGSGRWVLWTKAIELICIKPVFGCGPENLGSFYSLHGVTWDRPHNEYLQHAAFLGIPAALMYIGALISLAVVQLKNLKKLPTVTLIAGCAVIGYAISAFFGNTMYYTTPFFFMVLGFASHQDYEVEQSNIVTLQ